MKPNRKIQIFENGLTLAEVLVTLAIIGFAVPLILAATASALRSRQAAEFDTRANWILRDAQQRIMMKWASRDIASGIDRAFPFPTPESPQHPLEMHYGQDGEWMKKSSPDSVYLVQIEAKPYEGSAPGLQLARIKLTVQQPASAPANKRNKRGYEYITTRRGME
jgi:prepilin-type N-terminal cleavage/methylation domain-containing protein